MIERNGLKALIARWRNLARGSRPLQMTPADAIEACADELAAVLAQQQEDEPRYYALRDAVTMWAGDGVIGEDVVLSMATEHATIAQRCMCAAALQPPQDRTCDSCEHLTPFELTHELFTCPVVNIRIHRDSAATFGCNQHSAAVAQPPQTYPPCAECGGTFVHYAPCSVGQQIAEKAKENAVRPPPGNEVG